MTTSTISRQATQFDIDAVCPTTTSDALRRAALLVPTNEAVVDEAGRHSFADLYRDVATARSALAAYGVAPGDRVGICVSNSYEWIVQFLAITSRGAVAVPVNTRFRARDLEYCVKHSRMSFLFLEAQVLTNDLLATMSELLPELSTQLPGTRLPDLRHVVVMPGAPAPSGAVGWERFLAAADDDVPPTCSPDDPALIQYTSGSTSFPKGVLLSHRAISGNGFVTGIRMGMRAGDRLHSARPFFHVSGTTQSIIACIQQGAALVTMIRFTSEAALRLIAEEGCTHFSGNDTMATMLLDEYRRNPAPLVLRGAWLAASAPTISAVIDELNCPEVVVPYGLSEAAPNVTLSAWWEPEEVRRTATGLPQPGVEVEIRDPRGTAVADGVPGEIMVRGWNVMLKYWDDEQATAEVLDDDGWLSTGDLGALRDGRLAFLGRIKEIIRVGGENVAPGEVEDALKTHAAVSQVCVVGVPDRRLVEVVCAVVEPVQGAEKDGLGEALIAMAKDQIAGFKVPRFVVVVDSMEHVGMTASAKVRRADAREYAMNELGLKDT